MFLSSILLAGVVLQCAAHYSSSKSSILIYDDEKRASFFHGENFVQKGFPWYPEVLLDLKNIEEMQSWGFNTVRLGVSVEK